MEETDLHNTGVPEPVEGGLNLIVDLVDDQEQSEPQVDKSAERR